MLVPESLIRCCLAAVATTVLWNSSVWADDPLPPLHDGPLGQQRLDLVYGHKDGMALTLDVFEPKAHRKGIALMFMVSGGWVSQYMPPQGMAFFIKPLTDAGYTIIAVRHGSSPKYVIPEIVEDVRQAHRYVVNHAKQLEVDPDQLGVFGFSAGGHLSLMLGTTANDQPADKPGPKIAAVAAVFPPTDLEPYMEKSNPLRERFPALKFDIQQSADYSPLKQVSSPDAPTLLLHGDRDDLVPLWHSEKIRDAMTQARVPNRLVVFQGAGHGFDEDGNKKMFAAMLEWFQEHLGK
ncbi:MAG: alpha/beta hydrolase family protein [Pirellula sp.]